MVNHCARHLLTSSPPRWVFAFAPGRSLSLAVVLFVATVYRLPAPVIVCSDVVLSDLSALTGNDPTIRSFNTLMHPKTGLRVTGNQQIGLMARQALRFGAPMKRVGILHSQLDVVRLVAGRRAGSTFAVFGTGSMWVKEGNHVFTMGSMTAPAAWEHNAQWIYRNYHVYEFRGLQASEYAQLTLSADRLVADPSSVVVRQRPRGIPIEDVLGPGPGDLQGPFERVRAAATSNRGANRPNLRVPPPVGYEPRGPTPPLSATGSVPASRIARVAGFPLKVVNHPLTIPATLELGYQFEKHPELKPNALTYVEKAVGESMEAAELSLPGHRTVMWLLSLPGRAYNYGREVEDNAAEKAGRGRTWIQGHHGAVPIWQ